MSPRTPTVTDLLVRVYNVRFGDAVLVTIPEQAGGNAVTRNILFDFGNALGTAGGQDDVLEPVMDDIIAKLGGKALDLYVMTHEHLDHVQGLFHAAENLNKKIKVKQAWLTGSSHPDYYKTHEQAKKQKIAALAAYQITRSRLQATSDRSPFVDVLLANNDTKTTSKCVAYLRDKLTSPGKVHYVDRTTDLTKLQPSKAARIRLWAPEEDTADYYGTFKPLAAGLRIGDDTNFDDLDLDGTALDEADLPKPPSGVDAGAFYNLLDVRHSNSSSTLLSIDQASNNTSIVMLLEWNGWKLLFTGDAEKRSWRTMDKKGVIEPVHFLKVSHHGSHTGMPPTEILEKLLPMPVGGKKARAAVSTFLETYPGVPSETTLTELRKRTELKSTLDLAPGKLFLEFKFPSAGP
jgi:beta-lactamase superfamily II metal-dependent hydrolase